ncbi:MAG: phospholipase D family protein [Ottowia sp.]|nr:phospholipase D family protein [Ottowia sp.]
MAVMTFRRIFIALLVVILVSLAALWCWGRFARSARGPDSQALPVAGADTELDRLVQPLLDARPAGASAAALVAEQLDAFLARALSARAAGRSLDIQYYIWNQDLTGHLLERELLLAAERGVRVRLLLDDMNAAGKDPALLALSTHPHIAVRLFNPARNRRTGIHRALEMALRFVGFNRRMHNKAWIADNRVAVVGGRNVGDEYFGAAETNFRDTDLLLLGPAVQQTSVIFDRFWNSSEVIPLHALHPRRSRRAAQDLAAQEQQWLADAASTPWLEALQTRGQWLQQQLTDTAPGLHWSLSYRVLSDPPEKASALASRRDRAGWLLYDVMALLFSAQRNNWIMSPYFVPGEPGSLLLSGQAQRGTDVRVLTNSLAANDVPLVHAGYRKYRKKLLRQGVQLYELKPGLRSTDRSLVGSSGASLHSKLIVVDGQRGFVGSFNFDPRSAQLNTEMGVMFDQPELARQLQDFFSQSTAPELAWRVDLGSNDRLNWHGADGPREQEPQTSWPLRLLVRLLGLLPLESQL